MINRQGTKIGNQDATLEQRVQRLEELLRKVMARPLTAHLESVKIKVAQEAHGLALGQWVRPGGDPLQWVLALARLDFFGTPLARLTGVVTQVFNADHFEVTISGLVEGIDNPEDEEAGEFLTGTLYSLSEVIPGTLTEEFTTTRIECFQTTGPHSGMVLPHIDCRAELFNAAGGTPAGKVVNNSGDLADAAVDTNRAFLGVTINDYTDSATAQACRSGIISFPSSVMIPAGSVLWLDPTAPGELTGTKPTTPLDQKPIPIMLSLGANVYWVNPPGMSDLGITDLWDVDPTAPGDHEVLVWDDSAKRYVPGKIGSDSIEEGAIAGAQLADFLGYAVLANPAGATASAQQAVASNDGDVLRRVGTTLGFGKIVTVNLNDQSVTAAKLANANAWTLVGNGTGSPASPTGISGSADGQVLNLKASVLGFTEKLQLGTNASGLGELLLYWDSGKYFKVDAAGTVEYYSSATAQFKIESSGDITITWNSNTIILSNGDVVGTGRTFRIRELDICDSSGVAKKIQVLASATY